MRLITFIALIKLNNRGSIKAITLRSDYSRLTCWHVIILTLYVAQIVFSCPAVGDCAVGGNGIQNYFISERKMALIDLIAPNFFAVIRW